MCLASKIDSFFEIARFCKGSRENIYCEANASKYLGEESVMAKSTKKGSKAAVEKNDEQTSSGIDRRGFLGAAGLGAAGVATASATGLFSKGASAAISAPDTGITPGAESVAQMAPYTDTWNRISARPFGGFNFALGYIGEGVDMMDPKQDKPNPSGLFESANPAIVSGVGGNESEDRSAEYWYRGILKWSNQTIVNDFWSAINYMRRMWALDLDDPETDGIQLSDGSRYRYPGSPNPNDEISLWTPRIARDSKGGYVRMAPTLLAPSVGYTSGPDVTIPTTLAAPRRVRRKIPARCATAASGAAPSPTWMC
jgi:hypothetical protein